MAQRDVVEQYEMLVNLSHVTDVRNDLDRVVGGHDGDCQVLTNACQSGALRLDNTNRAIVEVVFPDHAIGNRLTYCDGSWRPFVCQLSMGQDVVRMGWFFNPEGIERCEFTSHTEGGRQRPGLIGVEHKLDIWADGIADEGDSPQVTLYVGRSYLELDRTKSRIHRTQCIFSNLLVRVIEPAYGGVIARVATLQNCFTGAALAALAVEPVDNFLRAEFIFQIGQIEELNKGLGVQVQQQFPEWYLASFRPEIETSVGD